MEVVKIPQVSLPPKEMLLDDQGQEVVFYDNALMFWSKGKWDYEDEVDATRKKRFFDNIYIFDKGETWTMEMYYAADYRKYILAIAHIRIFFGEEDENPKFARERCKELFDKIVKWKYSIVLK